MRDTADNNARTGLIHGLASIGTRAAAASMRPLNGAVGAATDAGLELERRAVDRVIGSDELERILITVGRSKLLREAMQRALESETAQGLIDTFFDSGLFDHFVDRLLTSEALWRLVDSVAQSSSVTAAISGQGLGFADQMGGEVRARSRKADDWLERMARQVTHRHPPTTGPDADGNS
jgi:hypothetical protein